MNKPTFILLLILFSCFFLSSCDLGQNQNSREYLVKQLNQIKDLSSGEHIAYLVQIAELDGSKGLKSNSIPVISDFLDKHPNDPYGSFVATLLAETWEQSGQPEFAAMYYQLALSWASDVIIRGESIQFTALQKLLLTETNPARKIRLLDRLRKDYPDRIDDGLVNHQLGFLYEQTGEFKKSYLAFQTFLANPGESYAENSQEIRDINDRVQLYSLDRNWTRPNLKALVNDIQIAIHNKDVRTMLSLKAPQGKFFSMSWLQEKTDFNSVIDFNIERFVLSSNGISFEDQMESYSNTQEAYLKSWGWSSYMPVWYLYFRKIDFPADPEFNGTWEWAGVYFGDTLQETELNKGL